MSDIKQGGIMKHFLIISTIILCFAFSAIAGTTPVDKGSYILGGSVSFTSMGGDLYEDANGESQSVFLVAPEFGYFFSPGFMGGAIVEFSSYSIHGENYSDFMFGPMVAYYFNAANITDDAKGTVLPYLKAFAMFGSTELGTDGSWTKFGGKGGINYFLSNAVAVDFGVQFYSDSFKPDGADESTTGTVFSFGAGIKAFIF